jgi:hypothetical protein
VIFKIGELVVEKSMKQNFDNQLSHKPFLVDCLEIDSKSYKITEVSKNEKSEFKFFIRVEGEK